jgi:hypothetical protein
VTVLPEELYVADPDDALHVARAELVLVHNDLYPLSSEFDHTPMWRFLRAFLKLDYELGERATIAVDLLPLTPRQRRRHRRRLARKAARKKGSFDPLGFMIGDAVQIRASDDASDLEQSIASQALSERLKQLENAFRIQVLIRVEARGRERAEWMLKGMVACFDQFTARNAYQVHGLNLGVVFLSTADLPLLRRFFDYRMRTGLFFPLKNSVVGGREIQWFVGPASIKDEMAAPDNYGHRLMGGQPLPEVPTFDYRAGVIPNGLIYSRSRGIVMAGTSIADTRLSFTAGKSGSGKTELAMNEFVQLARAGNGCLLLHPHADVIDRLRPYLTSVADRVIEVNLCDGADEVPGWNPLSMAGKGPRDLELRAQAVTAAFSSVLRWGDPSDETHADRAQAVLRAAVQSLLELSLALPDEIAPTLFQIPTIVADERWRRAVLPLLEPNMRRFWLQSFKRVTEDTAGPAIALIEWLRAWPAAASMLSAPRSTYDVRAAMDGGKAVLLCAGGFSGRERLVANLFAFDLLHAAMSRASLPPERRLPFYPILDHVEMFDGAADGTLAELLEQALQYQVFPHLVCERPASLKRATQQSIFTHDTRLAAAALDPDSTELLGREWTWGVYDPADVIMLDRFAFLFSQVGDARVTAMPYQATTVPLGYLWRHCRDAAGVPAFDRRVRSNSGAFRVAENLAELEVLDERIRRWAVDQADRGVARPAGGGIGHRRVLELVRRMDAIEGSED